MNNQNQTPTNPPAPPPIPPPAPPPPAPAEIDPDEQEDNRLAALRAQEDAEIEKMAGELMINNYDQLVTKFGQNHLFDLVVNQRPNTYTNVVAEIQLYRSSFLANFVSTIRGLNLGDNTTENLLRMFAKLPPETTPQQIDQEIKKINPTFALPSNFDFHYLRDDAIHIVQALDNIKQILANNMAYDYEGDVTHFVRLPKERLEQISSQAGELSDKLSNEYERLAKNPKGEFNKAILEEALQFLVTAGRTPIFIQSLRSANNAGEVADLLVKITTALQIANLIKQKFPQTSPTEEQILTEIKTYLMTDISI